MKTQRVDVLKALESVKQGLDSKSIIDQGDCFVFIGGKVATYNDSVAVSYPIDLGFEGAVRAKEFLSLLTKVKDKEIEIYQDGTELRIDGSKFQSGITMQKEIELPLEFLKEKMEFEELPKDLSEAVKLCDFSTASESLLPHLSNIHVKNNIVESCDNFRATRVGIEDLEQEFLIPHSAVVGLNRFNFEQFHVGDNWISFTKEKGAVFSCRLYEEGYPDISQFFDSKGTPIRLPSELAEILDKGDVFLTEEKSQMVLTVEIKGKKITIISENENGWYEESVDLKRKFEKELSFKVSPKIFKDILKHSNRALISDSDRVMVFKAKKFNHIVSLIKA